MRRIVWGTAVGRFPGPGTDTLRLEMLESRQLLAADPIITEFLARNLGGLKDGEGNSPDWIELHNAGDVAVDLSGYRLTDEADNRSKWVVPSVNLQPGDYQIIFASGQSGSDYVDAEGNLHTNFTLKTSNDYLALIAPNGTVLSEFGAGGTNYPQQLANVSFGIAQSLTLIDADSDAMYLVPRDATIQNSWTQVDFDAAARGFSQGKAAMGFESRPNNRTNFLGQFQTELPEAAHAVYSRMEFDLRDARAISSLHLNLKYDNGFVAYLNGVKVAEANAPAVVGWFSTALDGSRRDADAMQFVAFDLRDHLGALVNGTNVLAIHALNNISDNSDMLLVPQLSAGASDMMAATGSEAKLGYMPTPTPGAANSPASEVFSGFVKDTRFSVDRGFYNEPLQVEITTESSDAQIRYTVDGSEPTATTGEVYAGPITISTTTNLRAAAFQDDFLPTNVDTHTYLFIEDVIRQPAEVPGFPLGGSMWAGSNAFVPQDSAMDPDVVDDPAYSGVIRDALKAIPTMSITSDLNDIFGDTGWYDGEDVEQPVSVEIIYADDARKSHQANAGIESHSHDRLKRSLRLNFRREYGDVKFETDLFQTAPLHGESAVGEVDRIILRGGNNRSWARIWNPDKTAYTTDQFYRDTQIEMSGFGMRGNFVHLYINGVYWGLYNPTERADRFFTSAYFGGDDEDWFAVNQGGDLSGDDDRFDYLTRELTRKDMTDPANYAELQEYLNVESFADYLIISWWMAVSDWPQNNWYGGNRNETSELGATPFQYYAWDGEWAWGQGGQSSSTGQAHVHADFRANRRGGQNIPAVWHAARANDDFLNLFADRVYKHLFHDGALNEENAKARWMTLNDYVRDAVVAESARWGDSMETVGHPTRTRDVDWQNEVDRVLGLMTGNNDVFIEALRQEGFYPDFDPPTLSQHGGPVPSGFPLEMAGTSGTIYFTTDGSDPRASGGEVAATAVAYNGPVMLNEDATIRARVLHNGQWSARTEAEFFIASDVPLRITEINFDPHRANPVPGLNEANAGSDQFEFIELRNVGSSPLELAGVQLVASEVRGDERGIRFTFASQSLAPGEHLVVVLDRVAFQSRYGTVVRIASGSDRDGGNDGQFGSNLSNDGQRITLVDAAGEIIQQFVYGTSSRWPQRALAAGSSIEVVNTTGDYSDPANWRASDQFGGSPGSAGDGQRARVVINEVLASSSAPQVDMVELVNTTGHAVDIGNWYLSNTNTDYFKAKVPASTVIAPFGYQVVTETQLAWGFDGSLAGDVWLIEADATGRPLRFVDHVQFPAALDGVSVGPLSASHEQWVALAETTLGAPNSGHRVGDVVISEIYFKPADPDGGGRLRPNNFEFIELYNPTADPVDMTGWQLAGDVEFAFPDGTIVNPEQTVLVVGFNPSRGQNGAIFQFTLGADRSTPLLGDYSDPLDDESARIQLMRPSGPGASGPRASGPMVLVDELAYDTLAPWPASTAGQGDSLQRVRPDDFGMFPTSWTAASPSPGSVAFFQRQPGDANDDGRFDQSDIVLALQGGKFLTGEFATWADGDWTGDGLFDQKDIVAALQAGTYQRGP